MLANCSQGCSPSMAQEPPFARPAGVNAAGDKCKSSIASTKIARLSLRFGHLAPGAAVVAFFSRTRELYLAKKLFPFGRFARAGFRFCRSRWVLVP